MLHSTFRFDEPSGSNRQGGSAERGTVSAWAKTSTRDKPFTVVNELICNRLALILGLPVSEGTLCIVDGVKYFASNEPQMTQDSTHFIHEHVDILSANAVEQLTRVAVFDCWVVNMDRHTHNIRVNPFNELEDPAHAIDHAEALFVGRSANEAKERLQQQNAPWSAGGCLQDLPANNEATSEAFIESIRALPHSVIEGVCLTAVNKGYDKAFSVEDATWCARFLTERRENLSTLLALGATSKEA